MRAKRKAVGSTAAGQSFRADDVCAYGELLCDFVAKLLISNQVSE